jgi:hypothetical protein
MPKIIGAKNIPDDGEISWHCQASNGAGYDTLCGLALDDDLMSGVKAPRGQKCNCIMCYQIWQNARFFSAKNFEYGGDQ